MDVLGVQYCLWLSRSLIFLFLRAIYVVRKWEYLTSVFAFIGALGFFLYARTLRSLLGLCSLRSEDMLSNYIYIYVL